MDPILSELSIRLHRFIEDSLTNDLLSTDAELRAHYLTEGLTRLQADQALRYRNLYTHFMFFERHTPILKGYEALIVADGALLSVRDLIDALPESDRGILRRSLEVLDCHSSSNTAAHPDKREPGSNTNGQRYS